MKTLSRALSAFPIVWLWMWATAPSVWAQTKVGPEILMDAPTVGDGPSYKVALAGRGSGFLLAVFGQGQTFDPSGQAIGNSFSVGGGGDQSNSPSASELTNGDFIIFLAADGIRGQRYSPGGDQVGSQIQVIADTASSFNYFPVVTSLSGGGFVVVWSNNQSTGSQYLAQLFDPNAAPMGGVIQISQSGLTGAPTWPAVAALGSGGFVVCWPIPTAITRCQRYDATGVPVGLKIAMGHTLGPAVTSQPGGGFVVVWSYQGVIYGQRFGLSSSIGSKFLVQTTAGFPQNSPAVTRLKDGGFVVVWTQPRKQQEQSFRTVYGRLFTASAQSRSNPFRVDANLTGRGILDGVGYPILAPLTNGGFVVAWMSVFDKIFNVDGFAMAQAFVVP